MTAATLTAGDRRIRDAVLLQLEWDAEVDATGIGVAAKDNVVTLTGFVDTCAAKLAAERAATRVHGVKGVANDIQLRACLPRTDTEIAADAVQALELRDALSDGVHVVVHDGHITLTGTVATPFDRAYARRALRRLRGVKQIVNRIKVAPTAAARAIREIDHAPCHDAATGRRGIEVTVANGQVTLTGKVGSWLERDTAARAAAHDRGMTEVINHVTVASPQHDSELRPEDECD